jgi:general secretion pathway protein D
MKSTLLILPLLVAFKPAFAATDVANHGKLHSCIKALSDSSDFDYIFPQKLKGEVNVSERFSGVSENVDRFISFLLAEYGYSRLPIDKKTFMVINARDVRYKSTPRLEASYESLPQMPDNNDFYTLTYQVRYPELAKDLSRSFRPFLSRYGRIVDVKNTGKLIIHDTVQNLKKLLSLAQDLHASLPKDYKSRASSQAIHDRKIQVLKAKNCPSSHDKRI